MVLYNDDGTVDKTAIECTEGCGNHNYPGTVFCDLCGERQDFGKIAPYEIYVEKNFSQPHMDIITKANEILDDYDQQGFMLSLRQLYYQFVATVPGFPNTDASYKRLGNIVTDARLAGLISFDRIEDRGRVAATPYVMDDAAAIFDDIEYQFSVDMWRYQDVYVETWVEKDALSQVVARACDRFRAPYMACKGYMSASAMYEAGKRFSKAIEKRKRPIIIHLGDHDPSGIDMTRDIGKRLEMFTGVHCEVDRVALNRPQIEDHNPPPNPAKVTDSRAADYIREHGTQSWELDALPPAVIEEIITVKLRNLIDPDAWNYMHKHEENVRDHIREIVEAAQVKVRDYD